ncbi:hypothetical protein CNEO4_430070 [Clostridium neonatale]|nr:hypothetical protein CNEO4_430070 [Clostridium neonatale]
MNVRSVSSINFMSFNGYFFNTFRKLVLKGFISLRVTPFQL